MWVELEAWCLCRFPQHSPKSTCAKCEKYILILYCPNCEIYLFKFFQHIQVLLLICLCSFPRHPPNQCTQSQIKIQTLKFAALKISPTKYDLPLLKFQECVGVAYRHPVRMIRTQSQTPGIHGSGKGRIYVKVSPLYIWRKELAVKKKLHIPFVF